MENFLKQCIVHRKLGYGEELLLNHGQVIQEFEYMFIL